MTTTTRTTTALAAIAIFLAAGIALADEKTAPQAGGQHDHAMHGEHSAAGAAGDKPLQPSDDRTAVRLTAGERDFVLHEMRGFLVSVHGIVSALAYGKPAEVAQHAKASGMSTTHDVPREMMRKMPAEWRSLGMDTHSRFDTLALEAASMGDARQIMGQLAAILANCTGCHAAYRLVAE